MAPLKSNCLSDVASLKSFITIETIGQQVKGVLPVRGAMRRPHIGCCSPGTSSIRWFIGILDAVSALYLKMTSQKLPQQEPYKVTVQRTHFFIFINTYWYHNLTCLIY